MTCSVPSLVIVAVMVVIVQSNSPNYDYNNQQYRGQRKYYPTRYRTAGREMPIVDTHFHVWDLSKFQYLWPTQDQGVLFRDYTIEDYEENRNASGVQYSVFVQVLNDNIEEAKWLLEEANSDHPSIVGVVAGLNPASPKFRANLEELCKYEKFVGIRHILAFEEDTWITRDDVAKGLEILSEKKKTFDLLLTPRLLKYIPPLIAKLPQLKFVVDHIAKPFMADEILDPWREDIAAIAAYPNVYCKISSLVNQTPRWKTQNISPYINHVLGVFGTDRCMFASDWPVSKLAGAEYDDVLHLFEKYTQHLRLGDREKLLYKNAVKCYGLKI